MNTHDVLMYGQATLTKSLEKVSLEQLNQPGVCGVWSVKDIVAHLASYEVVLVELLQVFLDPISSTPTLERYKQFSGDQFNNQEISNCKQRSYEEVEHELNTTHQKTLELIDQISNEKRTLAGTLPWYGNEYSLDDFIVYTYYGHKREHSAQIDAITGDRDWQTMS